MNRPDGADLQRWSTEVARDPGAPSFLPLADAYRRQGRREAALRVCLRGLERHPTHVEAHALLGRLHLEAGDRERAADEWATVLRLDTRHFGALRGLGFAALERDDLVTAERHLAAARAERPGDETVAAALELIAARRTAGREEAPGRGGPGGREAPASPLASASPSPSASASATDPAALFASLEAETPFLGALVLDPSGRVVSGRVRGEGPERAEALGALLGGAVREAARTAELLGLGGWQGLLLESDSAAVHVGALGTDALLVLVAKPEAPAGWVVRAARRAAALAAGVDGGAAS